MFIMCQVLKPFQQLVNSTELMRAQCWRRHEWCAAHLLQCRWIATRGAPIGTLIKLQSKLLMMWSELIWWKLFFCFQQWFCSQKFFLRARPYQSVYVVVQGRQLGLWYCRWWCWRCGTATCNFDILMLCTSQGFLREHTSHYSWNFELQPNGMILALLSGRWEAHPEAHRANVR